MAKKSTNNRGDEKVFQEVKQHHDIGFQETDRRATGKNRIGTISFDEADELFRSYIDEQKWPYDALLFDPRVFTFIFEKTSRLISNKPKGTLIPRQGSNVLGARINNELLSYQWDTATQGGTMLSKWSLMDINARKYGASFALSKWRYECDDQGKVLFDGPEFQVLNNRDIAHDLSAIAIESCNWFQVRQYVTWQDLKHINDASRSKPIYKNLEELKYAINYQSEQGGGGDNRSTNWQSRNRAIAGLETDPVGQDDTFKVIEIVTEYRKDRWITFAPKHGVVIRDIPNPYKNNEIPVVMLRYYAIDDDLYGLSEIEPVKGLQKAINALLCQYVDEINQALYSPIAIGPGVRQHTLEWGKGARWIMNNPMSDFRLVESRSNAAQYFNNTYSVLVAAMMNALGESSLGVSNVQPYQKDKTATEVKALQLQRNARDNYNQIFLAEAIKRQMMLWHSMNQVLLFADPKTSHYMIRISGPEAIEYFMQNDLNAKTTIKGSEELAFEYSKITGHERQLKEEDLMEYKYPIRDGKEVKPKLTLQEKGRSALLAVEPSDINGAYDFIIDVESMQVNADEERKQARQAAVSLLATNPQVTDMLLKEGVKPKFKELFTSWLEDLGFADAERFFEQAKPQDMAAVMGGGEGGGENIMAALMGGMAKDAGVGGPGGGGAPREEQGESFQQGRPQGPNAGLGPISPKSLPNE